MAYRKTIGRGYTYDELCELIERDKQSVFRDVNRGQLDTEDLESLMMYAIIKSGQAFKAKVFKALTEGDISMARTTEWAQEKNKEYNARVMEKHHSRKERAATGAKNSKARAAKKATKKKATKKAAKKKP